MILKMWEYRVVMAVKILYNENRFHFMQKRGSIKMSERDVRAVETLTRTGICLDDLCNAFRQFYYEDLEVIFQRIRREAIITDPDIIQ